jgi:hypothetical protein
MALPADGYFEFSLPWTLRMVPFHGLSFCLHFRMIRSVSFAAIIRDKLSSSASKRAKTSEKISFLGFVFDCEPSENPSGSNVGISKITLPLPNERLRSSFRVVLRQASRKTASSRCCISRLTAVTGQPEQDKTRSSAFLFRKQSVVSPSDQFF